MVKRGVKVRIQVPAGAIKQVEVKIRFRKLEDVCGEDICGGAPEVDHKE